MSVRGYNGLGVPPLPSCWTECELCQETKHCERYDGFAYCADCRDDSDTFYYLVEEVMTLRYQLGDLRRKAKGELDCIKDSIANAERVML